MSFLSLFINWMHPWSIQVLIYFLKTHKVNLNGPKISIVDLINNVLSFILSSSSNNAAHTQPEFINEQLNIPHVLIDVLVNYRSLSAINKSELQKSWNQFNINIVPRAKKKNTKTNACLKSDHINQWWEINGNNICPSSSRSLNTHTRTHAHTHTWSLCVRNTIMQQSKTPEHLHAEVSLSLPVCVCVCVCVCVRACVHACVYQKQWPLNWFGKKCQGCNYS